MGPCWPGMTRPAELNTATVGLSTTKRAIPRTWEVTAAGQHAVVFASMLSLNAGLSGPLGPSLCLRRCLPEAASCGCAAHRPTPAVVAQRSTGGLRRSGCGRATPEVKAVGGAGGDARRLASAS